MKVCIQTKGRVIPAKGVRIMLCGMPYYIASAEEPTVLDDITCITEVDIQPGAGGKFDGSPLINAELVFPKEI